MASEAVLMCRVVTFLRSRKHHLHRLPCAWCALELQVQWPLTLGDLCTDPSVTGPLKTELLVSFRQGSRPTLHVGAFSSNDRICRLSSSS